MNEDRTEYLLKKWHPLGSLKIIGRLVRCISSDISDYYFCGLMSDYSLPKPEIKLEQIPVKDKVYKIIGISNGFRQDTPNYYMVDGPSSLSFCFHEKYFEFVEEDGI